MGRKRTTRQNKRTKQPPEAGRRKFVALGLGGLGTLITTGVVGYKAGWFGSASVAQMTPSSGSAPLVSPPLPAGLRPVSLTASRQNALRAASEITEHYTRYLNNPSTLIHAVRAFGQNFTLADGTPAVAHLCSRYAAEKEISGKRYVYFPREVEVHENSFLKTFLEAGVSLDQPITVGSNHYTLGELGESARSLFRCDPEDLSRYEKDLLENHLPWGLIAFSILIPPSQSSWTNAFGEQIHLPAVIDSALSAYEQTCSGLRETLARGEAESIAFRQTMNQHSCYGMHAVYGFFSCLKHGYRSHNLPERLRQLLDLVIYRLRGDVEAFQREYEAAKALGPQALNNLSYVDKAGRAVTQGPPPPFVMEAMHLRSQIKLLGHALEAINYVLLHRLFSLTPEQKQRVQAGEQTLYECLVRMRALDLDALAHWYSKFVSDTVIAIAHALRAMKLLTPDNPDTIARK